MSKFNIKAAKQLAANNNTIPNEIPEDQEFWRITYDKDEKPTKCQFYYVGFFKFVKANQFFRYRRRLKKEVVLVQEVDNKVLREVEAIDIKDLLRETARKQDNEMIEEMYYKSASRCLGPTTMEQLDYINPQFNKSMKDYAYLYFQDAIWKISKDNIERIPYEKVEDYIWEEKIIPFSPTLLDPMWTTEKIQESELIPPKYDITFEPSVKSDFLTYLQNTSNPYHQHEHTDEEMTSQIHAHFLNKITAMGYLLHQYKHDAKAMAVIGMDLKNTSVGDANGGTGKSIFGKAIQQLTNNVYINGKRKKLDEDQFLYDQVSEKTNFIFIDDIRINFDFQMVYNAITGEIVVNKKGKQKFTIPPDQVIKIFIATNYILNDNTNSGLRRQFHIGFSDYYNRERSPFSEFGHNLFSDWDETQWNYFHNIAARSIQHWLKYGKVEAPGESITLRRLRQQMGEDFFAWGIDYFNPEQEKDFQRLDLEMDRKLIFDAFLLTLNVRKRTSFSSRRFYKCMKDFCKYQGYEFKVRKSGGMEFWEIRSNGQTKPQDPDLPF